jgi:hypothetical protein
MKTPFIYIAILATLSLPARSQVLGIFEQGAEELSEYGQQIAALELLLSRQQKGYQIIESGLSSIGSITGDEFTLHQDYFTSLASVNPAINQTPEPAVFLSTESQNLNGLTAALARWRQSRWLTFTDFSYITRMSSVIVTMATLQISAFSALTSNDNLTMTDDRRIVMISQLYSQAQSLYNNSQVFINKVNTLIFNRKASIQ